MLVFYNHRREGKKEEEKKTIAWQSVMLFGNSAMMGIVFVCIYCIGLFDRDTAH